MREIELSKDELASLMGVLNARLQALERHHPTNLKHQRTIKSILAKIDVSDFQFSGFEKRMCRSCIVENLPDYNSEIVMDADSASLFSLRNLSEYAEMMDRGKDLVIAFGYKNGRNLQYFNFGERYRYALQ